MEKTENPINLMTMYGKLKAVIGAKLGWGGEALIQMGDICEELT